MDLILGTVYNILTNVNVYNIMYCTNRILQENLESNYFL